MYPVVIIERTTAGDAYRYTRIVDQKVALAVETAPAPVGKPLEILDAGGVETFRLHPERLLGSDSVG